MRHAIWGLVAGLALGIALMGSVRWGLRAQDRGGERLAAGREGAAVHPAEGTGLAVVAGLSVQEALLRPATLAFQDDTTLEQVVEHLRGQLKAPVVLDLAALARLDLDPQTTVRLHLEGVRLKTALGLLLEQVGLTFRVVPEDNLLVITDTVGAGDPLDRVLSELEAIHHDIHDLQDRVDDLQVILTEEEGTMEAPTIIEEAPPSDDEHGGTTSRTRPG